MRIPFSADIHRIGKLIVKRGINPFETAVSVWGTFVTNYFQFNRCVPKTRLEFQKPLDEWYSTHYVGCIILEDDDPERY